MKIYNQDYKIKITKSRLQNQDYKKIKSYNQEVQSRLEISIGNLMIKPITVLSAELIVLPSIIGISLFAKSQTLRYWLCSLCFRTASDHRRELRIVWTLKVRFYRDFIICDSCHFWKKERISYDSFHKLYTHEFWRDIGKIRNPFYR